MKKESSAVDLIARQLTRIVIAIKNGYKLVDSTITEEIWSGPYLLQNEDGDELVYDTSPCCLEKEKAIEIVKLKPYGEVHTPNYSRCENYQEVVVLTEKGCELWKYLVWEKFYSSYEGPSGRSVIQRWSITPQMAVMAIMGARENNFSFEDALERIAALDYLAQLYTTAA